MQIRLAIISLSLLFTSHNVHANLKIENQQATAHIIKNNILNYFYDMNYLLKDKQLFSNDQSVRTFLSNSSINSIWLRINRLQQEAYKSATLYINDTINSNSNFLPNVNNDINKSSSNNTIWYAKSKSTLKNAIQSWGKRAGWIIQWDSEYDYLIAVDIHFTGSFEEAMKRTFDTYKDADHPLCLNIYPNQKLMVISD